MEGLAGTPDPELHQDEGASLLEEEAVVSADGIQLSALLNICVSSVFSHPPPPAHLCRQFLKLFFIGYLKKVLHWSMPFALFQIIKCGRNLAQASTPTDHNLFRTSVSIGRWWQKGRLG